jgi:hypothetical protein
MIRVVTVLIAVFLSFPTGIGAVAPEVPKTEPNALARVPTLLDREEQALALIGFPWQKLQYDIVFLPPRRGFRAMTLSKENRIEIYARPGDDSHHVAYDIAHELGHAIDLTTNTRETRQKWLEVRGIDASTPWFGCDSCSDYNTPAGDFAETFALLLFGAEHFRGRIAPPPTKDQIPAIIPFFPIDSFKPIPAAN